MTKKSNQKWSKKHKPDGKHVQHTASRTHDTDLWQDNSHHEDQNPDGDPNGPPLNTQPNIRFHSHTNTKNEIERAEVASVRLETKKTYDDMKKTGASTNFIMDTVLGGKIGHRFHAAKMVLVFERSKERAREFKSLFPELKALVIGDTMKHSDVNKVLKTAGYNKVEGKAEIRRRKARMGMPASDDETEGGVSLRMGPPKSDNETNRGVALIDTKSSLSQEEQMKHGRGSLDGSKKRKRSESLSRPTKMTIYQADLI